MAKAYILMYFDFIEATEGLSDEECGRLVKAMLAYARDGEVPEAALVGNERFLFPTFRLQLDRDSRAYETRVLQNAIMGEGYLQLMPVGGFDKGFVEQQTATLKLLSTSRRVNSMIFRIELFQPDAVGGKIQPGEYELVMEDASGNAVSNVVTAHADMTDSDDTSRVTRCKFSLKAGRQYSAKEKYYLVCRMRNESIPVWNEEYNIDIAFAPADDFGF